MRFSQQKAFLLFSFASLGLCSPLQQSLLRLPCLFGVDEITDVQYGYQGPGVYNIVSKADYYNLALGSEGSADGVSPVVWYFFFDSCKSVDMQ